jgi:cobalt-zinc-cadmium resistance protein CzcA
LKTYELELDNDKLAAYGITLRKIITALDENNANAGGAYLERFEHQSLVRGEALISNLSDIENIVLGVAGSGTPILVRNVANVRFAPMVRQGFSTQNGKGEIVVGVAMMLVGENAGDVTERIRNRLDSIRRYLPPGVKVDPLYDRTDLVHRTIHTVTRNLVEGGLLVIAVLLLLLGSLKGGLVVSLAIPLSMLFAFIGMVQARISGNLMSLGAIDFGLIVDGSVVMVDSVLRRLSSQREPGEDRMGAIRKAGHDVVRPVFFGVLIILLVYVPVLLLGGVEGKMFKPMASTVMFAVAGSLLIALALMPVLSWLVFRKPIVHKETWLMRQAERVYEPVLQRAIRRPVVTVGAAAGVFALSLVGASFLGAEFIPRLDEGSLLIQMYRLPGISITESLHGNEIIENVLLQFPEVQSVYSRTGRAEVAIDPMAIDQSDVYIFLRPRSEWPQSRTKEQLVDEMRAKLHDRAPGAIYSFSQPIQMRTQEMMQAGIRSDVAVKIFGDDIAVLRQKADEIAQVLESVRGAADVRPERVAGMPYLRI